MFYQGNIRQFQGNLMSFNSRKYFSIIGAVLKTHLLFYQPMNKNIKSNQRRISCDGI